MPKDGGSKQDNKSNLTVTSQRDMATKAEERADPTTPDLIAQKADVVGTPIIREKHGESRFTKRQVSLIAFFVLITYV